MKSILKLNFIVLTIFSISSMFGQKQKEDDEKSLSPYFMVKSDNAETDKLPLKQTSANVNIVGMIADVTINQVYKSEGKNVLEAVYTFPASTNAAFYAIEMKIGDRTITAKIEEKQKAKKQYEKAKSEGKRTSLLEQNRPNVFTMNVANILPGDEIEVSLKYTEFLNPTAGVYEFIYPTVVGPRYLTKSENADPKNSFNKNPYQKEKELPLYNFDINVNLNAAVPIQDVSCKTHLVNTNFIDLNNAKIKLNKTEIKGGNRDFVLKYKLAGNEINSGISLYEGKDENFFMMMIQPPKRVESKNIPPREYIFINDVSGSMNGYPMKVSKKIMRNLVSNLRPEDRFNVMVFAGSSGFMSEKSLPATTENIKKAVDFIDYQKGSGGTEIIAALKKAISFPREFEGVSRSFVIVTDGYVNVEKECFELIKKSNNQANTFVFGIGSSVNRHLIEGMANAGNGEPFVVLQKNDADEVAEKFRNYITNPVLTQIKLDYKNFDVYDVEPITIADVFAERPIIVFGKYKGNINGKAKLQGYTGRKKWKTDLEISEYKSSKNNEALKYLWARKKIQQLDDYKAVNALTAKEVNEITNLGLKYNLLTNYTSFIAIDDEIVKNENIKKVKQALPLPQNVNNNAVGFELEIDEEIDLSSISFYKKIDVKGKLTKSEISKVKQFVEKVMINKLNSCFEDFITIESIKIKVNKDGSIKAIEVNNANDAIDCINEIIMQLDFKALNLSDEFEFVIEL